MKTLAHIAIALVVSFPALAATAEAVVRTTNVITTGNVRPGDRWTGSLAEDFEPSGGAAIPKGQLVQGSVEESQHPGRNRALLILRLTRIGDQSVEATPYRLEGGVTKRNATGKMIGWGAVGALVGGALHGGKGALVGAGAGAALGGARATRGAVKVDAIIPAETVLRFHVESLIP